MAEQDSRAGFYRVSTIVAGAAIIVGLALVATGHPVAGLVGVGMLVVGGFDMALDLERSVVPPRPVEIRRQKVEAAARAVSDSPARSQSSDVSPDDAAA